MAEKSFHVEVVSADSSLYSGEATFVIAQTTVGELGVLANHEPLLGQLVPGGFVVIVEENGNRRAAAVEGGFLSVTGEAVTVLAESADWADDVDVNAEKTALDEAEPDSPEYHRAHARLTAAQHLSQPAQTGPHPWPGRTTGGKAHEDATTRSRNRGGSPGPRPGGLRRQRRHR